MSAGTIENGFSSEAFFVAVIKSEAIKSMPQKKQESFKWFLFNAPADIQKQFFTIFQKEEAINRKYEGEKANFAEKLWAEYQEEVKVEDKKFEGMMRKKVEVDERGQELTKSEKLISNL